MQLSVLSVLPRHPRGPWAARRARRPYLLSYAAGGTADEAGAAALALPEAAVPPDLRAALHGAARMVSAAFPEAVSEIGAPPADDDKDTAAQNIVSVCSSHTSVRQPAR